MIDFKFKKKCNFDNSLEKKNWNFKFEKKTVIEL